MRFFQYLILLASVCSCSSEKVTVSPLSDLVVNHNNYNMNRNFEETSELVFYSSELTNQISKLPKFRNYAVNTEVNLIKNHIKNYIYAIEAYNLTDRKKYLENIHKSYKKIQELRKFLKPDEDAIINRYLVRIKSNISKLESIVKTDPSLSMPSK